MEDEELREGYIKVQYDLAPKTNGKKFATWCEKYGFTPLNGGRIAWNSGLGTYLRGASGVAFADGEMFLFYEEDLIDIEAKIMEARIDEVRSIKNGFDEYKSNGFETNQTIDELTDQMVARLNELKKEKH